MSKFLWITGDIHGDVRGLKLRLDSAKIEPGSGIILNGDVGLNYFGDSSDSERKKFLSKLPYTFFCVHGNHEMRPWEAGGYEFSLLKDENVQVATYVEKAFPNIRFLIDGIHIIDGKRVLVLSGAYSVDKNYRLVTGKKWWASEQMDESLRKHFLKTTVGEHYDLVISHTCPYLARPLDRGLSFVDQATVDSTMEVFLEHIRQQITYDKWFSSHWHIDEVRKDENGEIHFVFEKLIEI